MAIIEYLEFNLDYNTEELVELDIKDTKRAGKEDIIYFVLFDIKQVKEIHYRKVISENDKLTVRDYIAPNFYDRYMVIGQKAAQRRAIDKSLKTQIRWGSKDIEIFTKVKGSNEPLRKVKLTTFMELPDIDMKAQWKIREELKPRRKLDFSRKKSGHPSTGKDKQGVVRQLSSSSRTDKPNKLRADSSSSGEMDDSDGQEEGQRME